MQVNFGGSPYTLKTAKAQVPSAGLHPGLPKKHSQVFRKEASFEPTRSATSPGSFHLTKVKLLLERGHVVRGTLRDAKDPRKTEHLMALPGAAAEAGGAVCEDGSCPPKTVGLLEHAWPRVSLELEF